MNTDHPAMPTPTARQIKVLKAIHAAHATAREAENSATAGSARGLAWDERRVEAVRLGREVENLAAAAGVPPEWIEQVRTRGASGLPWNPRLNWRIPEPVDRTDVLTRLSADVRQVQDIAALVASHGEEGRRREVGTAQLIERKLRILGQRVAAVAWILDITADEAEQLWGAHSHWIAAAASVRTASTEAVVGRWRAHARSDTSGLDQQAQALTKAGLTGRRTEHGPPTPAEVVQVVRNLLTHPPTPLTAPHSSARDVAAERESGPAIAAAIAVVEFSAVTDAESASTPPPAAPPRDPFVLPELEP
ncbi:hypothetical protein NDR87_14180 [Nocardia sp. CDC159]|uniref:Uncharacterized protein n=1 Tax=Nocardia pulmonis TaxID=2951408 RepID=A0A9X2IWK8_9NOCA|nr:MULTISPECIES: hypothetical protein [Nocardia]MCM6774428.1 hypothetical protein [Nocardia pulmonis]MCM6787506.1 hypothetical protein [Nocardia sp. CDC159]